MAALTALLGSRRAWFRSGGGGGGTHQRRHYPQRRMAI